MRRSSLNRLGAALGAAALLAACSSGPPIHSTIGPGSTFCNDLSTFAQQAASLNNIYGAPGATIEADVTPVQQALVKLASEAPTADTVGGHSVKTDLNTEAQVYARLVTALQQASVTDPNSVANAITRVQDSSGGTATDATGRLNDYAKSACKVNVTATSGASGAPSTTGGPATSAAPVGPAVSTTTAGASGASTTSAAP